MAMGAVAKAVVPSIVNILIDAGNLSFLDNGTAVVVPGATKVGARVAVAVVVIVVVANDFLGSADDSANNTPLSVGAVAVGAVTMGAVTMGAVAMAEMPSIVDVLVDAGDLRLLNDGTAVLVERGTTEAVA